MTSPSENPQTQCEKKFNHLED